MARPKKSILKQKTITVHCSFSDHLLIKSKAGRCRLSMSEYLLKSGLDEKLEPKLSEEEVEIFRSLIGLNNNINQIARHLNRGSALQLDMFEDLEFLHKLLNRLK